MNILLVCPRYDFSGYSPTGLVSIAAVAEGLGHDVTIVDLNLQDLPRDTSAFDLVGITGLSLWKRSIIETANLLDDLPVIVGGPWASLNPFDALNVSSIDYVCVGEGEETFREFLQKYPHIEGVRGIGYRGRGDGGGIINPPRPFMDALDKPLPAWHLLDVQAYDRISIVTSFGCPFRCIFCSDHTLHGRRWRPRSVESVLDELDLLINTYGVKHITFGDENMTLIPERFEEICEGIIERGLKASFDAIQGVRADRLPFRLLDLMKKAGFIEIIIAPESGSQRVLNEVIHKNLDLSVVEPVVKHCQEIGLKCGAFFVIGFPWETMDEIRQTTELADRLRKLGCSCYVGNALPFPDTELYAKAKREGYLRFDGEELEDILYYLGKPRKVHCLSSPHWDPDEIVRICRREQKKNLTSVYRGYSLREIASKFLRHPYSSLKKAIRLLR